MNFKEVYKSANDNIKGDRTLIDKVYERAEKRHNNFFAPSFAAAVVAFALILYPTISTHHTKMPSGNETAKIAKTENYGKSTQKAADAPTPVADNTEKTVQDEKPIAKNTAPKQTAVPKAKEETAQTPIAETPAADMTETEKTADGGANEDIAVMNEVPTEGEVSVFKAADALPETVSGGGSASTRGKSIELCALLPSDMSFETTVARRKSSVAEEIGERLFAVSSESPDRYIEIYPSRTFDTADGGADEYTAQFTYNGTDYTLNAKNVTVAEIDALLKSLK